MTSRVDGDAGEDLGPHFSWEVVASGDEGPGPRSRHVLVHDRADGATLLFGGLVWSRGWGPSTDARMLGDTWVLRKGEWSPVSTPRHPSARHRSTMVYDDSRGCSVLFGGQDQSGRLLSDTWIYEGRTWEPRSLWPWQRPPGRCAHAMAYDEELGSVVVFGGIGGRNQALGDTWLFGGNRWTKVQVPGPRARRFASMSYDPHLGGCLLHGGSEDDLGHHRFGDSWLFRDGSWSPLPEEFATEARDDHGLAYHRSVGVTVMLEGTGGREGTLCLTTKGWRSVATSPEGPRHQCAPIAWDESLGGLVAHGGETGQGGRHFDTTRVLRWNA